MSTFELVWDARRGVSESPVWDRRSSPDAYAVVHSGDSSQPALETDTAAIDSVT